MDIQLADPKYVEKKKQDSGNVTYIYSDGHVKARHRKKLKTLLRLAKTIKDLRRKVAEDLDDPERGEVAMVVALIDETYERVGNPSSAEEGHFGVTTWRKKHVSFPGSKALIKYKGKAGVDQEKTVTSKRVVNLLKGLVSQKKADEELFPDLTAADVNAYLKPFKITAKDIRGFHANEEMKKALSKAKKKGGDEKQRKEEFKQALEETAKRVGHDPGTLKKDYLVPSFEENYLESGRIGAKNSAAAADKENRYMAHSRTAGHIDRMKAIRKLAKKKQWEQDSAMLAIMAPSAVVRRLKKVVDSDTVSPDGLHVTLLFLGKVADLDDATMKAIRRAAEKVCARHQPLAMRVSGAGMFAPGEDGTPVYVVPNAKGLSALQADLENAVGSIIDLPSEHGWVPHMTIAYSCDDKPSPPNLETYPEWTAKAVRLQVGGRKVADIALGRKKTASLADDITKEEHAYVGPLEEQTQENDYFRQVLFTGNRSQLVLMALQPGEDIGEEVHIDTDQFFRIDKGEGKAVIDGMEHPIKDGSGVLVPSGTRHNVVNTGKGPLKLYTVYSPPHHGHGEIRKTKKDAVEKEKKDEVVQAAMDRLPIASDPVLWSDEQISEILKTPHLREELERQPELLKAVKEQAEKRKGIREGLEPKDIGEWRERGWFLLQGMEWPLGWYRSSEDAQMARKRLVDMFAKGQDAPFSFGTPEVHAGTLQRAVADKFFGPDWDPEALPRHDAQQQYDELHKDTDKDAAEAVGNLLNHPFYEGARRRRAEKNYRVVKAPQDFEPVKEAVVDGVFPTDDTTEAAAEQLEKDSPGARHVNADLWRNAEETMDAEKEFYDGEAGKIAKRLRMKREGIDPDKMADDVPVTAAAGFIGRMVRLAERLDDSGDHEGAERLCRQMDLLISRRAHFIPSDKTEAPPMWRKNLDYGEDSPYYGSVKDFLKKYPGGLGEYIKKRRKSRKKRERKWKLSSLAKQDWLEQAVADAWHKNEIENDLEDAAEAVGSLRAASHVVRMSRLRGLWKSSQAEEEEEDVQAIRDDYIKDPKKAPREFVKYWSILLKDLRKKKRKKKGKSK